jgi:hypothetical protein
MAKKQKNKVLKENNQLVGFGGWLTVFLVLYCLGFFNSLFNLPKFLTSDIPHKLLFSITSIFSLIFMAVALILLFRKLRIAIKTTLVYFTYSFLIALFELLISIINLRTVNFSNVSSYQIFYLSLGFFSFFGLITSTLWFLYFLKSKRVKNTFVK